METSELGFANTFATNVLFKANNQVELQINHCNFYTNTYNANARARKCPKTQLFFLRMKTLSRNFSVVRHPRSIK